MNSARLLSFVLFVTVCDRFASAVVRINFEKCGVKGFLCENSKEIANKVDVIYTCSNVTGQVSV